MNGRKPAEPSPESISRLERQRLAQEEGARALAEVESRSIEIRKNMQRLRALREAREADGIGGRAIVQKPVPKKRKRRIVK